MKKRRSAREQAVALTRVRAAVSLQSFRPKAQSNDKTYNRSEQKRRWHKDQEGAFCIDAVGRQLPPQRILTVIAERTAWSAVGWGALCDHLHGNPLPARERFLDLAVAPGERKQGVGRQIADALLEEARTDGTTTLVACTDTADAAGLSLAASFGFMPDYEMLAATLNLEGYDLGPWLPAVVSAEQGGIRFVSLAEAPDPEASARAVWEMDYRLSADVPEWAGEVTPFEQYRTAMLDGPEFHPQGVILAWAGERAIGFCATSIQPDGTGYTWMLGVDRACRGRGIGIALKALTIDWAKRKRLARLQTHNNRANGAIVTLNVKMGYVIDGATQFLRLNLI